MSGIFRVPAGTWSLAVQSFPPPAEARAVVVCGHAMMCDRRTLDRPAGRGLASTLARRGLQVYTFDVRGHGESGPRAAEGGVWSYDEIVDVDVPAVVRWAHARHPDLPLCLLGHSLVGHAGLVWLAEHPDAPVSAFVAIAANYWLRRFEPSRWSWLQKRATLAAWATVTRAVGHFPARRLRVGSEDEARPYVESFARWAREDTCRRAFDGADRLARLADVRVPVLGVLGARDRLLCTPAAGAALLAPVPDHTIRVIPEADHLSPVLDPSSAGLWEEVAEWILSRGTAPPPPS